MSIGTRNEVIASVFFSVIIGIIFAFEFIPLSNMIYEKVSSFLISPFLHEIIFVLLAFIFYISLPTQKNLKKNYIPLIKSSFLPLTISFIFGQIVNTAKTLNLLVIWEILLDPIGEELLFRGWLFELIKRISKDHFLTLTNPTPICSIASSLAFSIWHIQNIEAYGPTFTIFQLCYTFFLGLWLSHLKLNSGTILWPIIAHIVINIASLIP